MKCYSQGDIIVTPTPYSKRLLEGYKGLEHKKIVAISNGIDLDLFKPDKKQLYENLIEFEEKLKADDINLMVCFISMEEGGAIINIGQEGFKERELIMKELQELDLDERPGCG